MSSLECPADRLAEAVETARADPEAGLASVRALLADHAQDARLHFLKGSLLAGLRRYDEAQGAMVRAVELAPGFSLARFQLGFLELTSGRGDTAKAVLAPLEALPDGDAIGLFARGLTALIEDRFDEAVALLERGMALNIANLPLNADMALLADTIRRRGDAGEGGDEVTSSAQMLLQQFGRQATKH